MKNIVIISSYANTEEKLDILKNYILQIKKSKYDILLISRLPVPPNIIELVNYCFYDKENFLLPIEKSPVTWFADDKEYINLYSYRHGYILTKNISIGLNFAKSLGYTNFIFSDYDTVITDEGVHMFKSIYDILQNTNKKIFVFKLNNQLYNKYNIIYRTIFFAGNIDFYLNNIRVVKSYDEWCTVAPYAHSTETIETLFVTMARPILSSVHEELTPIESYFKNSKFDVCHIFDTGYSIVYNLENKNKPLFFTLTKKGYHELNINNKLVVSRYYNDNEILKYKFNINESDITVELKCNDKIVVSKKVNIYSIEDYKTLAVRDKIK